MKLDLVIKHYFEEEMDADELQTALVNVRKNPEHEHYEFKDNDAVCYVGPESLLRLCKDVLDKRIEAEYLNDIAKKLQDSDGFEWDEEPVTEVLYCCLEPEENAPLNQDTTQQFVRWLTGEDDLPED